MRRFKPWRSISIDQGNVIYAGNEMANACAAEGYNEVVVVDLKPGQLLAARRSDMTETEKTAYGIADNKTGDSSFFSDELPAALHSLQVDGFDLESLGFDTEELKKHLGEAGDPATGGEAAANATLAERFLVPPFSILDARQGYWQDRKKAWIALGIESELGRGGRNEQS